MRLKEQCTRLWPHRPSRKGDARRRSVQGRATPLCCGCCDGGICSSSLAFSSERQASWHRWGRIQTAFSVPWGNRRMPGRRWRWGRSDPGVCQTLKMMQPPGFVGATQGLARRPERVRRREGTRRPLSSVDFLSLLAGNYSCAPAADPPLFPHLVASAALPRVSDANAGPGAATRVRTLTALFNKSVLATPETWNRLPRLNRT